MKNRFMSKSIAMCLVTALIFPLFLWASLNEIHGYTGQPVKEIGIGTDLDIGAGFDVTYLNDPEEYEVLWVTPGELREYKDFTILDAYWTDDKGNKLNDWTYFEANKSYRFVFRLQNDYYRVSVGQDKMSLVLMANGKRFYSSRPMTVEKDGNFETVYTFSFDKFEPTVLNGEIEVGGFDAPVVGRAYDPAHDADAYASYNGFDDSSNYVNSEILNIVHEDTLWTDKKNYHVKKGDKFEEGKQYQLWAMIKVNSKYYKFDEKQSKNIRIIATFEGEDSQRKYVGEVIRFVGDYLEIKVPFGKALSSSDANVPINSFTLEGLPAVIVGSTPMTDHKKITGTTVTDTGEKGNDLYSNEIKWYDSSGKEMAANQQFEKGKQYKVRLRLGNRNAKNQLFESSTPNIGSNSDYYFFDKLHGGEFYPNDIYVHYIVSPREASASDKIKKIKIEELPIVVDEKTYDEALGDVKITADGQVKVRDVYYEGNYLGPVGQGDTFDPQDDYKMTILLEPVGDYVFEQGTTQLELSEYVKKLRYKVSSDSIVDINVSNPKLAYIELDMLTKTLVETLDISFPADVLPVSGEKPIFDRTKFKTKIESAFVDEPNVNVNEIKWEVSKRTLSSSDSFAEGTRAALGVVVEPEDISICVVDPGLGTKFTINGESATAIRKDGKVIVSKEYQVKKSDKKPDPKKPQQQGQPQQPGETGSNQPHSMSFSDVMSSNWYYNYVKYVFEKGIMNGVGNNRFAPNDNVSRAMIVTMLYRIAKEPAVGGTTNFNDNTGNTWYTKAVKWTAQKGLAKDFIKGNFDPNVNLTREQMITIMYNYQKSRGKGVSTVSNLNDFKDGYQVSAYAQTPMKWAVKSGIIQGNEQKKINPQANVTRAEVAAIIQRFNELR